ncbi:MAG TPA: Bax inhibitor-1/YccA family protein, partial [Kineosporiaceae bacterium]|nr:Bax inhibitor-1/YccA family protein [Kineosporiaceae bacterium]
MESRNPVFSNNEGFRRGGYATFSTPSATQLQGMYDAPSATPVQTGRMTLDDVVVRTAMIFGVLLAAAAAMYFVVKPGLFVVIGAALAAMVVGIVVSASKTVRPALVLTYGALEGVFVGGVSYWYAQRFGNELVPQAVLGTLAAFATMLVLYKTGVIRNSPRFQKMFMIALIGYVVFGLVNLVIALTTGHSVYGMGLLGLAVAGV